MTSRSGFVCFISEKTSVRPASPKPFCASNLQDFRTIYFEASIAGAVDTGSVYSEVHAAAHQENCWRDTWEIQLRALAELFARSRMRPELLPRKPGKVVNVR